MQNEFMFIAPQSHEEAFSFLKLVQERNKHSHPVYPLLAYRLLTEAKEKDMMLCAIESGKTPHGADELSMLFSLPGHFLSVIQIVRYNTNWIVCRVQVLPQSVLPKPIVLLPDPPQSSGEKRIGVPGEIVLQLPKQYSQMPLAYAANRAFAPWVVATIADCVYSLQAINEMTRSIIDYIQIAALYGREGGTYFLGTETGEGEWMVLGYVLLKHIGDTISTKAQLLISPDISWVSGGAAIVGLPINIPTHFAHRKPDEDSLLACFLAKEIEVFLIPSGDYAWVWGSPVVLIGNITPEQFIANTENAERVYRLMALRDK